MTKSLWFLAIILGCLSSNSKADDRPNILLLVADDLGYANLGAYGSDIQTPNIDALAKQGILFTQFHTAPSCGPTRAMLLSGNNNHVAGLARLSRIGLLYSPIRGYEGGLSDRIAPLPRLLQKAGYHTDTVGKWHLGLQSEASPRSAEFSRAFNLLDGGGSYLDDVGFSEGGSTYRLDENLVDYPKGRYATTEYSDRLIQFVNLSINPGETNNMAGDEPEKFAELIQLWNIERRRLGIILPQDL